MGHTNRSPSGYDQWSVCTASVDAIEDDKKAGLIATDDGGSEYAREGTVAHALLAICLDLRMSPRDFMGEEILVDELNETFTVEPEMAEEVDKAYEYIMDFVTPGAQVWVEVKMPLDKVLPGQKGTADVVILPADRKRLHVFDLKYGKGMFVHVQNNSQMKLYGIGAFDELLDRKIRTRLEDLMLHVVQPRIGNIDNWVFEKGALERFRVEAYQRYQETMDPKRRKFVAGKHCWFCDRRSRCRTLKDSIYAWIMDDPTADAFDAFKNPDSMTDDELAGIHPMLSFIGAWATNVRKFMDDRAVQGKQYPGLKLVEGKKGARQWKDEKAADEYLKKKGLDEDQRYKKTLQSPAQAENIIGRKKVDDDFKKLFTQSDGKPSLAPDDDPRPSVDQSLADEFDDLD
ncbi:DUF2800 domain-containing protein [Marinobacter sp. DS40M6]|uniref:DUF2800 domain-containing protein n=1 Tax=Marinobacter sp. DS40M6 TaxID=1597776 RepID=UPI00235A0583|nr:DUF2800 domain-containing protein [Marinobacter sp. DS40M6]MDC8457838.1 DUF2800 domain-containing protein [Marinobacter sp. DS40M6]